MATTPPQVSALADLYVKTSMLHMAVNVNHRDIQRQLESLNAVSNAAVVGQAIQRLEKVAQSFEAIAGRLFTSLEASNSRVRSHSTPSPRLR